MLQCPIFYVITRAKMILSNILNFGISHAHSAHEKRFIKNINIAVAMSLMGFLSFGFMFWLADPQGLFPVLAIMAASCLFFILTLYLNNSGKYILASLNQIIILTLAVTTVNLFIENALQVHYINLLVAFSAVTLIGVKRIKTLLFFTAVNITAFIFVHNGYNEPGWYINQSQINPNLFKNLTIFTTCFVALTLAFVADHAAMNSENELNILANTDSLTKLYNRGYFINKANNEIKRCSRENQKLSFFIIDLDDFKNINDKYGHPAGDNVLVNVANLFKKVVRPYDTCSRLGGEEFGILLSGVDTKEALIFAKRILEEFRKLSIKDAMGEIKITASIGIATYHKNETYQEWYKRVDEALYHAKESGKNQIVTADITGNYRSLNSSSRSSIIGQPSSVA